jgi:hypothetical protein
MATSVEPAPYEVEAAKLRVTVDKQLGRETPEWVKLLAKWADAVNRNAERLEPPTDAVDTHSSPERVAQALKDRDRPFDQGWTAARRDDPSSSRRGPEPRD